MAFFGQFKIYIILGLVIAALSGALYFVIKQNGQYEFANKTQETTINDLKETVKRQLVQIENNKKITEETRAELRNVKETTKIQIPDDTDCVDVNLSTSELFRAFGSDTPDT